MLKRIENYEIQEILDLVIDGAVYKEKPERSKIDGYLVKMRSQRLETFKKNGCVCKECGLEATHFGLDIPENVKFKYPHFNLYALVDGEEILFTKDHIFPMSKGGFCSIENYQTMCQKCNSKKSSTYDEEDFEFDEDGKVYYNGVIVGDTKNIQKRPKKKKKKKKKKSKKTKNND